MSSPQLKLSKMVDMQRPDIPDIGNYGKLEYTDIKRLDRYIDGDIFGGSCCVYNGERKSNYTTLSYRSKKISVLRLLYHNYVSNIQQVDKIKYLCDNKGICCNIHHIVLKVKPPEIPKKRHEEVILIKEMDSKNVNDLQKKKKTSPRVTTSVFKPFKNQMDTHDNDDVAYQYRDTPECSFENDPLDMDMDCIFRMD
jgi:hypothetical protein